MALLLLNRRAGKGRAAALEPLLRQPLCQATGAGDSHVLATPDGVPEALALVRAQAEGSRVVVVGGDGSVHQLLPALLERHCSLALVPAGGGDDIARALGVHGLAPEQALQLALHGSTTPWDVAEVQTLHERRPFLSSLCVGFDAAVAARANRLPPWLGGRHRYTLATLLQLLGLQLQQVQLQVDGQDSPQAACLMAPVLNTPSYGGGLPAVPGARPDDGQLDLLHAGQFSRLGALRMLPALMRGRHLGHPQVQARAFRSLQLQAAQPLQLAADGESLQPSTHLWVQLLPTALHLVGRPQATHSPTNKFSP